MKNVALLFGGIGILLIGISIAVSTFSRLTPPSESVQAAPILASESVQEIPDLPAESMEATNTLPAESMEKTTTLKSDALSFNGHQYKVFEEEISWHEAKEKCEAMGGYLVCISDKNENDFVSKIGNYQPLWLGGTDEQSEGEWKWVSGEPFDYENWTPTQPSGDGNYLSFSWLHNRGIGWNDRSDKVIRGKQTTAGYICEWEK